MEQKQLSPEEINAKGSICNDCGCPCYVEDLLCGPCFEKQHIAELEEMMHPEWRCPPRE